MVEDRRDSPTEQDALAEAFERPATRPVATRTRSPPPSERGADAAEPADDGAESADGEPVHTRTRVP